MKCVRTHRYSEQPDLCNIRIIFFLFFRIIFFYLRSFVFVLVCLNTNYYFLFFFGSIFFIIITLEKLLFSHTGTLNKVKIIIITEKMVIQPHQYASLQLQDTIGCSLEQSDPRIYKEICRFQPVTECSSCGTITLSDPAQKIEILSLKIVALVHDSNYIKHQTWRTRIRCPLCPYLEDTHGS